MGERGAGTVGPGALAFAAAGALLFHAAAASPAQLRMAYASSLAGPMSPDSADPVAEAKRGLLDYFRKLGYTHILYSFGDASVYGDPRALFTEDPVRGWIYNGGRYAEGAFARSFVAMKREVEARGMRLVPFIETLSHVHHWIYLDPGMSEFPDWDRYCRENGIPCGYGHNHVAAVATEAGKAANPAADQFFRELLRIVSANWGGPPDGPSGPDFIHIGHDELGHVRRGADGSVRGPVCFVKAGVSAALPQSRSELVAAEIAARVVQATEAFGSGVRVLLYGDSFLPADNGEAYGLCGDPESGEGGVLRLLRDRHGLLGRIVVMPWGYSLLDGDFYPGPNVRFRRDRQLAFLRTLGYSYVPGTGEDAGSYRDAAQVERVKAGIFAWFAVSRAYPDGLLGYAHLRFDPMGPCAEGEACRGYSAPLLAYLAWTHPDSEGLFAKRKYSPAVFEAVDVSRSIREGDWVQGRHFGRPVFPKWWQFWKG